MIPTDVSQDTPSPPPTLSPPTWRGDLGGALGDLGTLLPFLVGFVVLAGVHPTSILLAFGLSLIAVGWRLGIPFPVQPMKAVGAAASASAVAGGSSMPVVLAMAALITGVFWLIAAWSGLARRLAHHVSRDVIHGVVLGAVSVVLALVLLGRCDWLTVSANAGKVGKADQQAAA